MVIFTGTWGCQDQSRRYARINDRQIDLQSVQAEHLAFANRFMTTMADLYDDLSETAPTDEGRTFALQRKIGNSISLLQHTTQMNPLAGMTDTVVMIAMINRSSQDKWFRDLYGEKATPIVAVTQRYEQEGWERLGKYLTENQMHELQSAIDRWRAEHPEQRYISATVDKEQFPDAIEISGGARGPGSVLGFLFLDPFAGLDPAMRQVELSRESAERMFFYMQRMPTLLSWQVDLLYRKLLLVPQTRTMLADVSRFSDATAKFADVSSQFAKSSEQMTQSLKDFPAYLSQERQRAIEQLAAEAKTVRTSAMEDLTRAVSRERSALLRETDEYLSRQRDAWTKQLGETVGTKTDASVEKAKLALNASIDHLFYRLLQYTLVVAVIYVGIMFLRRRVISWQR